MGNKRRRLTEGVLYLFSTPKGVDKSDVSLEVGLALSKLKCGRVLGSGTSLFDGGTQTVELGAFDCAGAEDAAARACRLIRVRDFEIVWD